MGIASKKTEGSFAQRTGFISELSQQSMTLQ
jgi:hypothetical protein